MIFPDDGGWVKCLLEGFDLNPTLFTRSVPLSVKLRRE